MGPTIDAVSLGVKNVTDNPMLIAISYAACLAMTPLVAVGAVIGLVLGILPIVGQFFARVLVAVPLKVLLLGGMVGVVGKAFSGGASFGDYVDAVTNNARSLAGAFAIYEVIVFAIGLVSGLVLLFVGIGGAVVGGMSTGMSNGMGIGILVLYLLLFAVFVTLVIVFQFIDVAVVLGDEDAIGALKESYRLFNGKPISVLGYTVTRVLLGFTVLLPGIVLGIAGGRFVDLLGLVGGLVTLLLFPAAFAVVTSYHAAYYGLRLKAR